MENMAPFPGADLNIIGPGISHGLQPPSKNGRSLLRAKPRKLIIKRGSSSVSASSVSASAQKYFEEVSQNLSNAVNAILSDTKTRISQEELYRAVENLCRSDRAQELWQICYLAMSAHADGMVTHFKDIMLRFHHESFLKELCSTWATWSTKVTMIRNVVFYLDRSYLLPNPSQSTVWEVGISLFYTRIIKDDALHNLIQKGINEELQQARTSLEYPLFLLKDIFSMIASLPDGEQNMRALLKDSARAFYDTPYDTTDVIGFATYASKQSDIERNLLVELSVPSHMAAELQLLVHDLLLSRSSKEVFPRIGLFLENNEKQLFNKLYQLAIEVDLYIPFQTAFQTYIMETGSKLAQSKAKGTEVIASLIAFHASCMNFALVSSSHTKPELGLIKTLRAGFQTFLNKDNSSSLLEKLSKYSDELLRGVNRAETALASSEEAMADIIKLFQYIDGKDVFEVFYKKDLAKRLLQGKTTSIDNEKLMVAKLKVECGAAFTHKLEIMLKDMDISDSTNKGFQASPQTFYKSKRINFQPQVLTQGHWPTFPQVPCTVPKNLLKSLEGFESYYLQMHNGRKITWYHSLGNCIVKANFPLGEKELNLNFLQAIVLLQFNDKSENVSYADIKKAVGMEDSTLKRTLQSLACGKIKVLIKEPKGKEVDNSDIYSVNLNLKEKAFRLKINQLQAKTDVQESRAVRQEVLRDRHMEIQAAIIRIMKSRKRLSHIDLVQQTIEMTKGRGTLDAQEIKMDIEKLIERDYLERADGDSYQYT